MAEALFIPCPVCGLICCLISLLVNQTEIKSVLREVQLWSWGKKSECEDSKNLLEQHKNPHLFFQTEFGTDVSFPCILLGL